MHTRTHTTDHKGARVVYMEILLPRTNTVRNKNGSLLDCYLYMRTFCDMRVRQMEGTVRESFSLLLVISV